MQDFYYTIMSSLGSETKFLYPVSVTQSISSMRTPNLPGRYIPGSSVIIIPFSALFHFSEIQREIRGYQVLHRDRLHDRNIFRNRFPRLYLLQFYRHQNILLRVLRCQVQQAELLIRCRKPFHFFISRLDCYRTRSITVIAVKN